MGDTGLESLTIAVQGCCHGQLNKIYSTIAESGVHVDLLLICGDFEAIRDRFDLMQMSVPPKYRDMGDFHEYFNGWYEIYV